MSLLGQLPAPPAGKSGWPWMEETPPPETAGPWPRITVITPSYQQGAFLEHTIRSVLLQNYPNLEYFVLDGGSTDGSREIIEKYAPWLAGWRCARDTGQAAAVNEGWARAGGDVMAWINSDDWYYPGALAAIAPYFCAPHLVDWVSGSVDDCGVDGTYLRRHPARPTPLAEAIGFHQTGYYQPGMFWSRRLVEKIGRLDEDSHLCFDLDFWARSLVMGFGLVPLEVPIACFRQHFASKTSSRLNSIIEESRAVFHRYAPALPPAARNQSIAWLREYTSDILMHMVYGCLHEGNRAAALDFLFREWRTALGLRPRKLLFGLLYRSLISGSPPGWFSGSV